MKTSEFTATDSITLKAELAEIYKQAREEKMYTTNRVDTAEMICTCLSHLFCGKAWTFPRKDGNMCIPQAKRN